MNIIENGQRFVESLRAVARRTAWDWRRCPRCGETETQRHGTYRRRPWSLGGRREERVQRHWCLRCLGTYSEQSALLVRGSWYAREVQRCAIDHWQHGGSSVRRTAEWLRSLLGKQERWRIWRPLDGEPEAGERCRLSASTVERWLDRAGQAAQTRVAGQLAGVATSGQLGTDGLWVRLRGKAKRVVLVLVDSVSGVVWPAVVAEGESEAAFRALFRRAALAGLDLEAVRGVASDGASGLIGYVERALGWVNHQRCVWHLWRQLGGVIAERVREATRGLPEETAEVVREALRAEVAGLVRALLDASDEVEAEAAWLRLTAHQVGAAVLRGLETELDAALVHLSAYNQGLMRVSPEWCWRDFRLRLGHGRNEGSPVRLERTALLWTVYHNFEPAQERSERKRSYRRPGQSPLAMAGVPPNRISYLDALGI